MIGIILYSLGVMYTPGPVNILSLNRGMQYGACAHIPFCLGVGGALCFWFLLIGYAGSAIVNGNVMPFISALGVGFILYLAYKIISSDVDTRQGEGNMSVLKFRDGLLMQLLNPKSFLVVLPVTTIQFPAAGIEGSEIALWSIGLGTLGFGAPFVYAAVASKLSHFIRNRMLFKVFNYLMGVILVIVALDIAYKHIYLVLA